MLLPNPKSHFLCAVVDSLKKRTKALKHKWFNPVIDRVIFRSDSNELETLEIRFDLTANEGSLFCSAQIFEDRWVWISARKIIGKSVKWDWSTEGRLLKEEYSRELTATIEKTSDLISLFCEAEYLNDENRIELRGLWRNLLASGNLRSVT